MFKKTALFLGEGIPQFVGRVLCKMTSQLGCSLVSCPARLSNRTEEYSIAMCQVQPTVISHKEVRINEMLIVLVRNDSFFCCQWHHSHTCFFSDHFFFAEFNLFLSVSSLTPQNFANVIADIVISERINAMSNQTCFFLQMYLEKVLLFDQKSHYPISQKIVPIMYVDKSQLSQYFSLSLFSGVI